MKRARLVENPGYFYITSTSFELAGRSVQIISDERTENSISEGDELIVVGKLEEES